ncbi:MAG TPA: hypothetical protein VJK51_04245 [Candidatus Nanoarchaeia archaeon]|nr:hypothetical protein [Candidatus Nanoarchaeia archaeon]
MKLFSREKILDSRNKFIERGYQKREAHLDGRVIDYFVLPMALFEGIPNGLFRMTGDKHDGYLVGVSDQVPAVLQPPFAVSEHDEFMVYGLDDVDRTLHSEQNMVRILERSPLRRAYISHKLALYDYLLKNSERNAEKWLFTAEDCAGFGRAREYLENELQWYWKYPWISDGK